MEENKVLNEEVEEVKASNFIYDFIDEDLACHAQETTYQKCFDIIHLMRLL